MQKLLTLSLLVCMLFTANVALAAVPSNLVAKAVSSTQVDLSWQDNTDTENDFQIYRKIDADFVKIADVDAAVTRYSDTSVSGETVYAYKVRDTHPREGGFSSEVFVTVLAPPTNLAASASSAGKIDLSWNAGSSFDGYIVQRDWQDKGKPLPIDTVDSSTLTYSDTGLPANTTFDYRVCAYKGTDPLNPDSVSDYATLSSPVTTQTSTDTDPPQISDYDPKDATTDGGNLSLTEQTDVTVNFDEPMNTKSILDSYFNRIRLEPDPDVEEGFSTVETFLLWFGDPAETMKYNKYGGGGTYGQVVEHQGKFDVDFTETSEGDGYDILSITIEDPDIGPVVLEPGQYKLELDLTRTATDLAGTALLGTTKNIYQYFFSEEQPIANVESIPETPVADGAVTFQTAPGISATGLVGVNQAADLIVNTYNSTDLLAELPEGITGFVPLKAIDDADIYAIGWEFDPPVTPTNPIRITMNYDDTLIPDGPDEESIRMYHYNNDVERWQPVIGAGFQPDTDNNKLYIDYQGGDEYSILALMSGYPYGDTNGDGRRTIDDAALMLNDFVGKGELFPDDSVFGKAVADLDYNPEGRYDPNDPDTWADELVIDDVAIWLNRFVQKILEFPVLTNWRNYLGGGAPSLVNVLPALDTTKKASLQVDTLGEAVIASVNLDDSTNVFVAELWLTYDATFLEPVDVSASDGLAAYNNDLKGRLHIASAPLSDSSSLADVRFELLADADKSALASIRILEVKLNDGSVPVSLEKPIPDKPMVLQNYPNPFNPETWIPFQLNQAADVTIRIYDVNGHLVRRLILGEQMPGNYVSKDSAAYWDGQNNSGEKVASGVYFYQFEANGQRFVKKMMLLK
jgi:hypothetical protein